MRNTGALLTELPSSIFPTKEDLMTPNIETIIRDHVTLSVRCIDRIYGQGYMPKLQTSGGLCYFLHDYLGHPVPSPALFKPRHDRFVAADHDGQARFSGADIAAGHGSIDTGHAARFGRVVAEGTVACVANPRGCLDAFWKNHNRPSPDEDEALKQEMPVLQTRLKNMMVWDEGKPKKFGADTRAVLAEHGYSAAEIEKLLASGVALTEIRK